ncbi:hypothetical protein AB6A40_008183 [Gnathostoma spinigerum]|uniref:F-box domain-containing protein n=1 Tax=Gnathostoma spinigerum TaxID=75299 RepID=A0ABD6ETH3_9BILA
MDDEIYPLSKKPVVRFGGYRFIENSHRSVNSNFPHNSRKEYIPPEENLIFEVCPHLHTDKITKVSSPRISTTSSDVLPDDILIRIFRFFHPIDYIHKFALVSKRWYSLSRTPFLWTDLRVIVSENSLHCDALRNFLNEVQSGIRRLCIRLRTDTSNRRILHALPELLDKITHLDMGHFDGLSTVIIVKISHCFPNIRSLNFYRAELHLASDEVADFNAAFFDETVFRNLQRFICFHNSTSGVQHPFLNALMQWNRNLVYLDLQNVWGISEICNAPFAETLTTLHTGVCDDKDFSAICNLENVKELWITSLYVPNKDILKLKILSKLEHLHLETVSHGIKEENLVRLFELPETEKNSVFPSKLKCLRFGVHDDENIAFPATVIDTFTRSCPDLESLNICGNRLIDENGLAMIVGRLRQLRFLNIYASTDGMNNILENLSPNSLPKLQFLRLRHTPVCGELLHSMALSRRSLIINTHPNFIVTFKIVDGIPLFSSKFSANMNLIENGFREFPGFCCV